MNQSFRHFDKSLSESKTKMKSELERSLRGLNFGKLYLKNGEFETAFKYVNSYLSVRPNSSEGHKLLAQIYEAIGDDDKAVVNYRKALDLKKGSIESFSPLSDSQMNTPLTVTSIKMNNNKEFEVNSNPSVNSTPERRGVTPENDLQNRGHSCGTCSNETVLYQMAKQMQSLIESNKNIFDIIKQNNQNINEIQQQMIGFNESIINLNETQNALKDTIYEYMTQEDHQDFDEYISDKENETLDSSALFSSNLSHLQSPVLPLTSISDQNKPLSELFKPTVGSWTCEACYVQNDSSQTYCASCETPKPGMAPKQPSHESANTTFQLNNVEPFSFKPSFTSSTSSFKFGAVDPNPVPNAIPNPVSNLSSNLVSNLDSNSVFSKNKFSFGNNSNADTFPTFGSSSPQFSLQSKPNESKPFDNLFTNNSKTTENQMPFQFGFNSNFNFDLPKTQISEAVTTPIATSAQHNEAEEENTSFSESQVEPSNADNIYFQPVVPLPPKVEVKTGEEEESVRYVCRARLFRFSDNEWKERGVGELKILESSDSKRIRLLMRRDTVLKVCLNQYITQDLKLDLKEDKKSMTWSAIDYSEDTPNPQIFLLRLKNAENAELFLNAFRSAQSLVGNEETAETDSKPNVGKDRNKATVPSKPIIDKKSEIESKNNLTINDSKTDEDLEIVYIKTPKSEEHLRKVRELKLPLNFYDYEDMEPCKGCRGCESEEYPLQTTPQKLFDENSKQITSNTSQESLFHSAIMASNINETNWMSNGVTKPIWTTSAPVPLFSSIQSLGQTDDDNVISNPDIYFKPIIPLPDLVEVQTGEEEETPIYCQRAKLYRFDPNLKEWKERGIGDFKILKHKTKDRFRLILRRDQILKIACNHYITSEMVLKPMNTSETAICWVAVDYTEGNPVEEQFALKLKNKELLQEFIKTFNECKSNLKSNDSFSGAEQVVGD